MLDKFVSFIQERWGVIRPHLVTFLIVAGAAFAGGWISAGRFYDQENRTVQARLDARDDEISRLRIALGIDPAPKGALIALTNGELKAKSLTVVSRLRDVCFSYRDRQQDIEEDRKAGKIDDKTSSQRWLAANKLAGDEFDKMQLRPEAYNLDNELRRRLDPQAVAAIPGILPSLMDTEGNRFGLLTVTSAGGYLPVAFTCLLAEGIERMADLLPPDPPHEP